jgi:deoxyribonuclease V
MKLPRPLHRWSVTPKQAIALQQKLADRILAEPLQHKVELVAGADMAFTPDKQRCVAGVVVYDLKCHQVIESASAVRQVRFPYVPGLLTFREAPAVLAAIRKLKTVPDVFMFDGQGYAHPRRMGLAAHVGLLIDHPSLGCAKSRLCGEYVMPKSRKGSKSALTDQDGRIGTVLRTRDSVKPVFVSIGHRMILQDAERITLRCTRGYRIPEPTRQAHHLVTLARSEV